MLIFISTCRLLFFPATNFLGSQMTLEGLEDIITCHAIITVEISLRCT